MTCTYSWAWYSLSLCIAFIHFFCAFVFLLWLARLYLMFILCDVYVISILLHHWVVFSIIIWSQSCHKYLETGYLMLLCSHESLTYWYVNLDVLHDVLITLCIFVSPCVLCHEHHSYQPNHSIDYDSLHIYIHLSVKLRYFLLWQVIMPIFFRPFFCLR